MPPVQGGSARQMASNGTGAGAGAPPRLAARMERSEFSNKRELSLACAVGRGHPCVAAAPAACLILFPWLAAGSSPVCEAGFLIAWTEKGCCLRVPATLGWGCPVVRLHNLRSPAGAFATTRAS